jgi:hypothetical protein
MDHEEEIVAPTRRGDKRKPLPTDLPRTEVTHAPLARIDLRLPQARSATKPANSWRSSHAYLHDQTRPQGLRLSRLRNGPATDDKLVQFVEKSVVSPSVGNVVGHLDGLRLHRFEKVLVVTVSISSDQPGALGDTVYRTPATRAQLDGGIECWKVA